MPELLEPPLLPFKLGEAVELGAVKETLVVMTCNMVLPSLTVTMVVVTMASD